MTRRAFLKTPSTAAWAGAVAVSSQLIQSAVAQPNDEASTFRRPKIILPVPTPSL